MIALYILFGAGFTALEAWAAMLLIGALHSEVPEVPDFSYSGALWLVVLVNLLVGSAVGAGKASE
jgi:hypothetical protein